MSPEESILEDRDEVDVGSACQFIKGGRSGGNIGCCLAARGAQFWGEQDEIGRR